MLQSKYSAAVALGHHLRSERTSMAPREHICTDEAPMRSAPGLHKQRCRPLALRAAEGQKGRPSGGLLSSPSSSPRLVPHLCAFWPLCTQSRASAQPFSPLPFSLPPLERHGCLTDQRRSFATPQWTLVLTASSTTDHLFPSKSATRRCARSTSNAPTVQDFPTLASLPPLPPPNQPYRTAQ